jgi:hypothetical protein
MKCERIPTTSKPVSLKELKPGDLFLLSPEHCESAVLMRLDSNDPPGCNIPCVFPADGSRRRYPPDTMVYRVEETLTYHRAE